VGEYPTLPAIVASTVKIDAGALIRGMDTAMTAVSKDDTLPILTGIRIEVSHGTMTLLATDRYRLVLAELPVEGAGEYSGLLRSKTWKNIKRVLNAKGGLVTIGFCMEDRWLTFDQGELSIGSLMIDGDYPKIRSLFPDSPEIVFEVDADLLAAQVASVSVTAERNTPVRFTYNGIDSLRIDAGTGEDAQAEAFMPYSSPRGNRGFAVAFNPYYLADVLKDLKGQTILLQHSSAPKPMMVTGTESDAVKHLIMPVRLPGA
jgi:DNA polymerase-3 subunit beta